MSPIRSPQPPPDPEPEPITLTDRVRAAALDEMAQHCAASTWQAFLRSLRARAYPLALDDRIT